MNHLENPALIAKNLIHGFAVGLNNSNTSFDEGSASESSYALFNENFPENELSQKVDGFIAAFPQCQQLSEFLFDIGLIKFILEGTEKEGDSYFESPAWMDLENETLERGSEFLNILIYLKDCEENEIQPSLDDFLNEFLLVEEDEFQDEYEIYEPIIRNAELVSTGSMEEIYEVTSRIKDQEIEELFAPILILFRFGAKNREVVLDEILTKSPTPAKDAALFSALAGI